MQARLIWPSKRETRPHLETSFKHWAICKVLNKTPKVITVYVWKYNTQVWKLTLLTLCCNRTWGLCNISLHSEFSNLATLNNWYAFQYHTLKGSQEPNQSVERIMPLLKVEKKQNRPKFCNLQLSYSLFSGLTLAKIITWQPPPRHWLCCHLIIGILMTIHLRRSAKKSNYFSHTLWYQKSLYSLFSMISTQETLPDCYCSPAIRDVSLPAHHLQREVVEG